MIPVPSGVRVWLASGGWAARSISSDWNGAGSSGQALLMVWCRSRQASLDICLKVSTGVIRRRRGDPQRLDRYLLFLAVISHSKRPFLLVFETVS